MLASCLGYSIIRPVTPRPLDTSHPLIRPEKAPGPDLPSPIFRAMSRPVLPLPHNFSQPYQQISQPQFPGSDHFPPPPPPPPPGGGDGGAPGRPTYAKRGKITIVACLPCRKRKTKVGFARSPSQPYLFTYEWLLVRWRKTYLSPVPEPGRGVLVRHDR